MNYNDFPILNDEQYRLMQDKFNEQYPFDRKEQVFVIFNDLIACNNACTMLCGKVNNAVRESLNFAKSELEKTISNLEATFNLSGNKTEIKDINFFNFLKRVTKITKLTLLWHQKEEKEYFKRLSLNISLDLINIILNLNKSLENSNISMFKYM